MRKLPGYSGNSENNDSSFFVTATRQHTAAAKYQPVQTRVYGNTGVVTEKENVTTSQGSIEIIPANVWVKDQGRWKLVLRQNTLVP